MISLNILTKFIFRGKFRLQFETSESALIFLVVSFCGQLRAMGVYKNQVIWFLFNVNCKKKHSWKSKMSQSKICILRGNGLSRQTLMTPLHTPNSRFWRVLFTTNSRWRILFSLHHQILDQGFLSRTEFDAAVVCIVIWKCRYQQDILRDDFWGIGFVLLDSPFECLLLNYKVVVQSFRLK